MCALLTLERTSPTATPRLKAGVSIKDYLIATSGHFLTPLKG